jgi:hypothetical protein
MSTQEKKKKILSAYDLLTTDELFDLLTTKDPKAFRALVRRTKEVTGALKKAKRNLEVEKADYLSFSYESRGQRKNVDMGPREINGGWTTWSTLLAYFNQVYHDATHKTKQEYSPAEMRSQFSPTVITGALRTFYSAELAKTEQGQNLAANIPNLLGGYGLLSTVRDVFYFIINNSGMQSTVPRQKDIINPDADFRALLNSYPTWRYNIVKDDKGKYPKVPNEEPRLTTSDAILQIYANKMTKKGEKKPFEPARIRMFYILVIVSLHSTSGVRLEALENQDIFDFFNKKGNAEILAGEYEQVAAARQEANPSAASAAKKKQEIRTRRGEQTTARKGATATVDQYRARLKLEAEAAKAEAAAKALRR